MFNLALFTLWGTIKPPEVLDKKFNTVEEGGIGELINLFINLLVVGAGLYALFNFILAGYAFLSAGGDPKKVSDASTKIWQSVLGLAVAAGGLVLAAIFGNLLGFSILEPEIPVP